jgi:tRNA pseudouridine38-40 synthase
LTDLGSRHNLPNKRQKWNDDTAEKNRNAAEGDGKAKPYLSVNFTSEEIAAESRRPKRKVAVMIGYAGTGYSGLQINHDDKTIESDIFRAFVAAGAISKANADDPKKSSLSRCARTDKGVHAAGNLLSLKLIIEDEDVVDKINANLPEQIRVWGIQRTNNGFNCYQSCNSRWYEYLMPSYALLPPSPQSFLGKKIIESAKEKGVYEEYLGRLEDVQGFWEEVDRNEIQPILQSLTPDVRAKVVDVLKATYDQQLDEDSVQATATSSTATTDNETSKKPLEDNEPSNAGETEAQGVEASDNTGSADEQHQLSPTELAIKEVKAAYVAAKRRYRVTPDRVSKFQAALDLYKGTHNFHNYTIQKNANDPSAKRHIKSFMVNPQPISIRDTEWLSIKVHGQSFMMHQIRKMIAMAVMVTRCGTSPDLIPQTYGPRRISIPKAPGLGLMLERPIFDDYNKRATEQLGREAIDFDKFDDQIQQFKDREIYSRMFEVEEKENSYVSQRLY